MNQIRATLAILLQFCQPTDTAKLYEKFREAIADDLIYSEVKKTGGSRSGLNLNWIFNQVLLEIDDQLARTFAEEYFDSDTMSQIVEDLEPDLNVGQAELCEELYQAVHGVGELKVFIVSSPGGFGKTY